MMNWFCRVQSLIGAKATATHSVNQSIPEGPKAASSFANSPPTSLTLLVGRIS